jgi:hypothetical protein
MAHFIAEVDTARGTMSSEGQDPQAMPALPPELPISPRVKSLIDGHIRPWTKEFARRSDIYVNCDEKGNEDPAAWQGRGHDVAAPSARHYIPQNVQPYGQPVFDPSNPEKKPLVTRALSSQELVAERRRQGVQPTYAPPVAPPAAPPVPQAPPVYAQPVYVQPVPQAPPAPAQQFTRATWVGVDPSSPQTQGTHGTGVAFSVPPGQTL